MTQLLLKTPAHYVLHGPDSEPSLKYAVKMSRLDLAKGEMTRTRREFN